jgi:hypothetical protein
MANNPTQSLLINRGVKGAALWLSLITLVWTNGCTSKPTLFSGFDVYQNYDDVRNFLAQLPGKDRDLNCSARILCLGKVDIPYGGFRWELAVACDTHLRRVKVAKWSTPIDTSNLRAAVALIERDLHLAIPFDSVRDEFPAYYPKAGVQISTFERRFLILIKETGLPEGT